MNPPDRSALEAALVLKNLIPETHLTAIHLGPESGEQYLRESLALGCDRAVRIWDSGLEKLQPSAKALLFVRVAAIIGYDLLFTGNASQDFRNGQVGLLMASHLRIPCITSVLDIKIDEGKKILLATKKLERGYQAKITSPLPALVTMETVPETCHEPSISARMQAGAQEIHCFTLAELGISDEILIKSDAYLSIIRTRFPEPKLKYLPAPDQEQSGFVRIAQLIRGTVQARQGNVVSGSPEEVAEKLFQTLLQEGWLDHLKKNG
jgi:electron transfer flavoprotein beta subunit